MSDCIEEDGYSATENLVQRFDREDGVDFVQAGDVCRDAASRSSGIAEMVEKDADSLLDGALYRSCVNERLHWQLAR